MAPRPGVASELAAIHARLRRLEDRDEIHQLFVDYGHHLDAGDLDAYVELFTDDGELQIGPFGAARGHGEIRATMERALTGLIGSSFHLITSPRVEIATDGESATAEVMWSVLQADGAGRPEVRMIGRHRDELRREHGRWRIARRRGFVDIPRRVTGSR